MLFVTRDTLEVSELGEEVGDIVDVVEDAEEIFSGGVGFVMIGPNGTGMFSIGSKESKESAEWLDLFVGLNCGSNIIGR